MAAQDHTPEQIASAWATLDLALAHKRAFDMDMWVYMPARRANRRVDLNDLTSECGTTACFAGWHAARHGYKVWQGGLAIKDGVGDIYCDTFTRKDLGLNFLDGDKIFSCENDDIEQRIEDEFGPRP